LNVLLTIQQTVSARVAATLADHPEWPCRAGCDHCCRHLAAIPEITAAEWDLLREGLDSLGNRDEIVARLRLLEHGSKPFTCPMLDLRSGHCLTYEQRPIACRTYGFYVERDRGLYCDGIRLRAEAGEYDDVVWGSKAAIEERTASLGPTRSLVEWFRRDSSGD
jgi:Fe-S-cluster containining protein